MKISICIPCQEKIDVETVQSLVNLKTNKQTSINFLSGSLVYDAREKLSQSAIADESDYVLFIDSDMTFNDDMLEKMVADNKDIVCGLFFRRKHPFTPCLFKRLRAGLTPEEREIIGYEDYPKDSLFEVDACGFGAILIKTKVLREIYDTYKTAFIPFSWCGEDLSFCIRAKNLGYKIFCDSRIKVGHLTKSVIDEDAYIRLKENQ